MAVHQPHGARRFFYSVSCFLLSAFILCETYQQPTTSRHGSSLFRSNSAAVSSAFVRQQQTRVTLGTDPRQLTTAQWHNTLDQKSEANNASDMINSTTTSQQRIYSVAMRIRNKLPRTLLNPTSSRKQENRVVAASMSFVPGIPIVQADLLEETLAKNTSALVEGEPLIGVNVTSNTFSIPEQLPEKNGIHRIATRLREFIPRKFSTRLKQKNSESSLSVVSNTSVYKEMRDKVLAEKAPFKKDAALNATTGFNDTTNMTLNNNSTGLIWGAARRIKRLSMKLSGKLALGGKNGTTTSPSTTALHVRVSNETELKNELVAGDTTMQKDLDLNPADSINYTATVDTDNNTTGRILSAARRMQKIPMKLTEKLALRKKNGTPPSPEPAAVVSNLDELRGEKVQIAKIPLEKDLAFNTTDSVNYTTIVTKDNGTSRIWTAATKIKGLPKKLSDKLALFNENETLPEPAIVVSNIDELRDAVLLQKIPLKDIVFNKTPANYTPTMDHPVMRLIAERVRTNSTPGDRAESDTAHLALAIEGGGMRGAVSAGMAAATASLGMTDAFDSIYGSSAGCVVGAYMISRQMCVDVYTDVLPAAKDMFASKRRVMGNLGVGIVNDAVARLREKNGYGENFSRSDVNVAAAGGVNSTTNSVDDSTSTGKTSRLLSLMPSLMRGISQLRPYFKLSPGMNISFVLDGIMSQDHGLRPFDMEAFRINDAKQPLRVIASTVRGDDLETVAFRSSEGDFWDIEVMEEVLRADASRRVRAVKALRSFLQVLRDVIVGVVKKPIGFLSRVRRKRVVTADTEKEDDANSNGATQEDSKALLGRNRRKIEGRRSRRKKTYIREATACPDNPNKKGFFACIEASMLVPGAAGPPITLLRSKHRQEAELLGEAAMTSTCFDAFCYEPIPYRSAVEDGATHVLALRSRPEGCFIETKPAVYERVVAPVYFRLNGLGKVADFFSSGGSQYRYLEDVMTLDEGLVQGSANNEADSKGVKIPPTQILFGTDKDKELDVDIDSWKRAHLLPVTLPAGTQELPSLTQDKDEVVMAVREGYAAAFDMLAPIVGLNLDDSTIDGMRVAELLFPNREDDDMYILETPVTVKGEVIESYSQSKARSSFIAWMARKREARRKANEYVQRDPERAVALEVEQKSPDTKLYAKEDALDWLEAEALLAALPGFRQGKLNHLSVGLRSNRTLAG